MGVVGEFPANQLGRDGLDRAPSLSKCGKQGPRSCLGALAHRRPRASWEFRGQSMGQLASSSSIEFDLGFRWLGNPKDRGRGAAWGTHRRMEACSEPGPMPTLSPSLSSGLQDTAALLCQFLVKASGGAEVEEESLRGTLRQRRIRDSTISQNFRKQLCVPTPCIVLSTDKFA